MTKGIFTYVVVAVVIGVVVGLSVEVLKRRWLDKDDKKKAKKPAETVDSE